MNSTTSVWAGEGRRGTSSAGLDLPIPQPGEAAAVMEARVAEYNARLSAAGLSLFHNFFRIAGGAALLAMVPALLMRADRREEEERE